jgi:DNA (cytosine-5)-methyltransferase 1
MKKKIRVAELFAGVGGFRLGLEGWNGFSGTTNFVDFRL